MQTGPAQQSIEEFVKTNWADTSAVQYDNVAFNTDLYEEFCRCTVLFGRELSRTVTMGCYRQTGVLMFSVFVKPSTGTARLNELVDLAASLLNSAKVYPVPPLVAPVVKFLVSTITRDMNEKLGWVMAQVSCPFYYDI